ncbi:HAMP domain-containing histidine kinase [bacterium]|nr:HAMP domain-containing histidine kinase [bacterium]
MKYGEISLKNVLLIVLAAFLWFVFLYFQSTYKEQSYIKRVNTKYAKSEIAHMKRELEQFRKSAADVLFSTISKSPEQMEVAVRLLRSRYPFLCAVCFSSGSFSFISGNEELLSEKFAKSKGREDDSSFIFRKNRAYLIMSVTNGEYGQMFLALDPKELFATGIRFRKDMPLEVKTEDWGYISQRITEKTLFPIEYGYEGQIILDKLAFQVTLYPDKVLRYSRSVFWKNISLGIALFLLIFIQFLGGGLLMFRKKLKASVKENKQMIQRLSRIADRTFRVDIQGGVLWASSIETEGNLFTLLDEKGRNYFQEFVRPEYPVPYVNFTSEFMAFSGKLFRSHIHLARIETGKGLEIIVAVNMINGSERNYNNDISCERRIKKVVSAMLDISADFLTMLKLNLEVLEGEENKAAIKENINHSFSQMARFTESVRKTITEYKMSRISVELSTLIQKIVEDNRDALEKRNIFIKWEHPLSLAEVNLDPEYFSQAFAALLEVAVPNLMSLSGINEISITLNKGSEYCSIGVELPSWRTPIKNCDELADLFSIEKNMKDEKSLLLSTGLAFCRNLFRANGIRMEFGKMSPSGLRIILKITIDE